MHAYVVWCTAFLWPSVSSRADTPCNYGAKCRAMNPVSIAAAVSDSRLLSCFAIMKCLQAGLVCYLRQTLTIGAASAFQINVCTAG